MGNTYVSGDWHGCLDIAEKVFDFLKEDDHLIFLGDAIDRGSQGVELLMRLLSDPRVTFLKGNHEEFLLDTLIDLEDDAEDLFNLTLWFANGGGPTWDGYQALSEEDQSWLKYKLKHLPESLMFFTTDGKIFCLDHSGFTPKEPPFENNNPLWNRNHFLDNWNRNTETINFDNIYVVHGHTPVQHMLFQTGCRGMVERKNENAIAKAAAKAEWNGVPMKADKPVPAWKPEVLFYAHGHKINIDMGTYWSDRIALLNLDTFETIYFDKEDEQEVE